MDIPVEFYNEKKAGKKRPVVKTVGELRSQLERLPDDLPLDMFGCDAKEVVVYNHGEPNRQCVSIHDV